MREQIGVLIGERKLDALFPLLEGATMSLVRDAARQLVEAVHEDDEDLFESIQRLIVLSDPSSQHLACQMIPEAHALNKKRAIGMLPRLIESEDWKVRDAACEVAGRLLREDFSQTLEALELWRSQGATNLDRAIVIAAIRSADPTHLERAEPLLKLLEPLLEKREPIVRRILGPSAIGAHLLAHYPNPTFEYLVRWSTSNDAQTLWHVAMALSAPAAVPITKKALIVLRKLSLDERRYVWRAVASALWKLGRKRPDIIRPELARWLNDDRRVNVAREAIKHL